MKGPGLVSVLFFGRYSKPSRNVKSFRREIRLPQPPTWQGLLKPVCRWLLG